MNFSLVSELFQTKPGVIRPASVTSRFPTDSEEERYSPNPFKTYLNNHPGNNPNKVRLIVCLHVSVLLWCQQAVLPLLSHSWFSAIFTAKIGLLKWPILLGPLNSRGGFWIWRVNIFFSDREQLHAPNTNHLIYLFGKNIGRVAQISWYPDETFFFKTHWKTLVSGKRQSNLFDLNELHSQQWTNVIHDVNTQQWHFLLFLFIVV